MQPLQLVNNFKYLGVTFSGSNNLTTGLKATCQQASKSQTIIDMHVLKHPHQGWGQVQLTKYSSTPSTPNAYQVQVLVKYSFF